MCASEHPRETSFETRRWGLTVRDARVFVFAFARTTHRWNKWREKSRRWMMM